jgi:hypothetical protein
MTLGLDLNEDGEISNNEARYCLLPFFEHYRDLHKLAQLEIKILGKIQQAITENFLPWRHDDDDTNNNKKNDQEVPINPALPGNNRDL